MSTVAAPESSIEVIPYEELQKIDAIIARYGYKPGYLIPMLKDSQEMFGYLPAEVQRYIAKGLKISPSHIYGVVSFYSFFTMIPRGKYTVRVCLGTACYVKGAPDILAKIENELGIKMGETTEDKLYTIEVVRCLGACGLAPVVVVNEDTHGSVTPGNIMDKLSKYK